MIQLISERVSNLVVFELVLSSLLLLSLLLCVLRTICVFSSTLHSPVSFSSSCVVLHVVFLRFISFHLFLFCCTELHCAFLAFLSLSLSVHTFLTMPLPVMIEEEIQDAVAKVAPDLMMHPSNVGVSAHVIFSLPLYSFPTVKMSKSSVGRVRRWEARVAERKRRSWD